MAKFHSLKVTDVKKETADCVSVAFEIPESLKNDYQYSQGQYVTLKMNIGGEEIRRSYSLCSCPLDGSDFRIAAKQVKDGRMSVYLNETLKTGDSIEVMTPMGNFYHLKDQPKNIVLFAGGSGVTPMLSIVKTLLHKDSDIKITMFYGNLNEEATIFRSELGEIVAKNPERLKLIYVLDKPENDLEELYKGLMSKEKIVNLINKHIDLNNDNEFFICGPTPMMKNTEEALQELNVAKEKVHLEYFTATLDKAEEKSPAPAGEKIVSQVTVILDGEETSFELASDGKNILDAAMDMDVDVPFSCKGAVCCTCRAKVLEGKVSMKANYALTEEEVEEGFILTCQSHPQTAVVVVDYDV